MRHNILFLALILFGTGLDAAPRATNKLLYMYRLYYLPFSIDFRQGGTINEILPEITDSGQNRRLMTSAELQTVNNLWDTEKKKLAKKSLFEKTNVPLNQTVRISSSLRSHKLALSRRALDSIPLAQRMQLIQAMQGKSERVKALFKQLRFLKSFLSPLDLEKFNFYIVSADWCESCQEYRIMLESYFKKFPNRRVNLHSIEIEDPKEKIFEAPIMKELFPSPKRYSHESIPRFLAFETVKGEPKVYEEGRALQVFYERYMRKNRGYLNARVPFLRHLKTPSRRSLSSQ